MLCNDYHDVFRDVCRERAVEKGGDSVSHEHILTQDADGDVWVVVLEMDEVRLYP
jgi:hypothetical protein